jgi:hypothetical protein
MKRESRAPLIVAIVLLLLPVLYVGSYFVLVVPEGFLVARDGQNFGTYYRIGGAWSRRFYWPMEEIDQKIRPRAWGVPVE